jgi:hypothetical protein
MKHNILGSSRPHLLITFTLSIAVLVAVIAVGLQLDTDLRRLTEDGSFISDLGSILWCVAATVCFFAAILLRNNQAKDIYQFLLYSGLLTTYLFFDDFFQIHDHFLHYKLGISEKITYIALGIATFILIIKFRQTILRTNFIIMLMGLGFLAISVVADGILAPLEIIYSIFVIGAASSFYLFTSNRPLFMEYVLVFVTVIALCMAFIAFVAEHKLSEYVFEEGAKWMGISGWCSYYVHTAYQFVVNAYTDGTTRQQTT